MYFLVDIGAQARQFFDTASRPKKGLLALGQCQDLFLGQTAVEFFPTRSGSYLYIYIYIYN